MPAVYTTQRAAVGARSLSLKITVTDIDDGTLWLNYAALTAGATPSELASLPIYTEFLNKAFPDSDAITGAFADLGASICFLGYTYTNDWSILVVGGPEEGVYPGFFCSGLEGEGVISFRISLASSIAS